MFLVQKPSQQSVVMKFEVSEHETRGGVFGGDLSLLLFSLSGPGKPNQRKVSS